MNARDRWRLTGNLRWDSCKVGHVDEAAPGHVNGKVIVNRLLGWAL